MYTSLFEQADDTKQRFIKILNSSIRKWDRGTDSTTDYLTNALCACVEQQNNKKQAKNLQ